MYETKDSGSREEYDTGAVRDTEEGKGRFDLLPMRLIMAIRRALPPGQSYYDGIRRFACLLERGAAKYDDHNWLKGIPGSRGCSSMLRHAWQGLDVHLKGKESRWYGEDHLAAVVFNACVALHGPDFDLADHLTLTPAVEGNVTWEFLIHDAAAAIQGRTDDITSVGGRASDMSCGALVIQAAATAIRLMQAEEDQKGFLRALKEAGEETVAAMNAGIEAVMVTKSAPL